MNGVSDRKPAQLNTLMELTSLVISTLDTREVRIRAIEAATRLVNAEAGSLILKDKENSELFFEVALGDKGEKVKEIRLKKGEGIAGWVVEKGKPVIVHDVQSDPRFFRGADDRSEFFTRNMICVPVKTKEEILGALQTINKKAGSFDNEDLEILCALANQVAVAIENANLYQELKDTFYGTAQALAETIEKRDPYTGGHTKRVMNYSLAIGRMLGLSRAELENLKLSAILHDIGKIGVRDNVLLKDGKLEGGEIEAMNLHPKYGSEILSHVKQLKDVIPGMRGHHEKYDGTGYPDGLKDNDIPLAARIIAVADTFDAMTTDRPYRKARTADDAFAELKKHAGRQFDPSVVNAFLKAWREMEIVL
ncbi:MAG: phosphohydrolase [Nitrospirae bacterium GWF2_44_13]|nr:MAG: phosphohydrolase [Nitrospirae bacterium GWF2_44_13]OGW63854.1 MAG: phosphohydrolase [Nitrospirae bacterium RIFOXYA2_FULL_44_9]HBG92059.1 phosphohydrolase [Nitrospiraceae bacterium]